jgi:hypothetical protein
VTEVSGWWLAGVPIQGNAELFRCMTSVGGKRGVKLGQMLAVIVPIQSEDELFHDMT